MYYLKQYPMALKTGEKSLYGRKYMGTSRTTFLVDENGIIEYIFQPKEIKTSTHAAQVGLKIQEEKNA
jgi:peroxiredoxin